MTKKDFIALASAIIENNRFEGAGTMRGIFNEEQLGTLADFCASRNPQFKRERWLGYIRGENGPHGGQPRDNC
jgi:hypothetical protein